jgi:ElaA protein
MVDSELHLARFADLDARLLHDLMRLRVDVFVVEQECPYPELDGRDTEPSTWHAWTTLPGTDAPTAYLRALAESDGSLRIGRVCTHRDHRGQALAAQLMRRVLDEAADRVVVLDAQTYLAAWYQRFGFVPAGPEFVEDGIPHIPMIRRPGGVAGPGGQA